MENKVVAQSSYDNEISLSNWLTIIPFEHTFRKAPHELFVQRLILERWLFWDVHASWPLLTIAIYYDSHKDRFQRTFESCILQSALHFDILIVCRDNEGLSRGKQEIRDRLRRSPFLEKSFEGRIAYCQSLEEAAQQPGPLGDYLVCIKSGDIFHPSFVTSFYLEVKNSSPPAEVYFWNEMIVDYNPMPKVQTFIRKPQLELYTLFHLNYISYNFAFQTRLLSTFSDFDLFLNENDAHLFLLSVLKDGENTCTTIPQYLLLRDSTNVRENRDLMEPFLQSYRRYFHTLDLGLELTDGPAIYGVIPNKRAKSISIIIPFRDRPELTCQAIYSVFEQKVDALIEIILVNNQSCPDSIEYINRFVEASRSEERIVRFLDYNLPFNHSAQCNLGVRSAAGECLMFLNNDVELISPDALMQMASWSLLVGIGTVGIRIMSTKNGMLASAGIALRLASGPDYNSMVEECCDQEFAHYNRETSGNTFACAAISKRTFESIGSLDEVNFPNGYNDVDYNMRCRKAGLRNIYLGTLCAVHVPGTSRGRSDELYQKILLRRKYPELFRESLFQLGVEKRIPTNKSSSSQRGKAKRFLYKALQKFGIWQQLSRKTTS